MREEHAKETLVWEQEIQMVSVRVSRFSECQSPSFKQK